MSESRGPEVPDHEDALRAILDPNFWVEYENRPSSAAFDKRVFSVDIASQSTPQETASRFPAVCQIVQFNCGEARKLEFDTRQEAGQAHPDNEAHAHVYFDGSGNRRKKQAQKLARSCDVVVFDNL